MECVCMICNKKFEFTEKDIAYYKKRGWRSIPKTCKGCRKMHIPVVNGLKSTSFYDNAQVFGMPYNVAGGTDIVYTYEIRVMLNQVEKYVSYSEEDKFLFLAEDRKQAWCFGWHDKNRIVDLIKNDLGQDVEIKCIPNSHYVTLRD